MDYLNIELQKESVLFPVHFVHDTMKRLLGIPIKDDTWSMPENIDLKALNGYGVKANEARAYIQYKNGHASNLKLVYEFLTKTGGPDEEWQDVTQKLNTAEHSIKRKQAAFECQQINRCNIESYDVVQFYQPGWTYEHRGINTVPQVQPGYVVVRADQTFVTARPWVTPEDISALKLRVRKWLYSIHKCEPPHVDGLILPIYGEL